MGNKPNEGKEKRLTYLEKQKNFEEDFQKFQRKLASNDIIRDINKLKEIKNPSEEELKNFIEKYDDLAEKKKFHEPKMIFLDILGEYFVRENMLEDDFDVFSLIQKTYTNLDFDEKELEKCKTVLERFEKEFDTNMNHIVYDITKEELRDKNTLYLQGINQNLKFNKDCQPNALTLILNEKFLDNEKLIEDLYELISNCPTLQIVNYFLYPRDKDGEIEEVYGLDGSFLQMLYYLVEAVSINKNIKSFFLHCVKDYNIILAPEISNLIIRKLQSETLVAFHLGNFNISEGFVSLLEFQLSCTKTLIFFSLENTYTKQEMLSFKRGLSKNRSIMAICVVSSLLEKMKKEVKKIIKSALKCNDAVVYLSEKSLFDITKIK